MKFLILLLCLAGTCPTCPTRTRVKNSHKFSKPEKLSMVIPDSQVIQDGNDLKVYVIYFSSDSCIQCYLMQPVIDTLKKQIRVYHYDVEQDEEVANRMGIRSIPTTVVMSGGKIHKIFEGPTTLYAIKSVLPPLPPPAAGKPKVRYKLFG